MSKFELKLPRMGESVAEATLTAWLKEVGDTIELDEPIFEIATDKVDSEVPSEVEGTLVEKLFEVDDVIQVGQTVAIIETEGAESFVAKDKEPEIVAEPANVSAAQDMVAQAQATAAPVVAKVSNSGDRFYSPLVKNIARQEGITPEQLDAIEGTGKDGRVTKNDILNFVANGSQKVNGAVEAKEEVVQVAETEEPKPEKPKKEEVPAVETSPVNGEVIEMSRMGKLIAKHMTESVATSAHVQSFIEVDVTNVVNWRLKVKDEFEKREGEKLTFTPIFMEAVAKALKKYPMMNISVDGDRVIKKKNINLGMAAALPDGNLIVPVIKNADQLNMVGMARVVNDLAIRPVKIN